LYPGFEFQRVSFQKKRIAFGILLYSEENI
jgi:hypothetical protein